MALLFFWAVSAVYDWGKFLSMGPLTSDFLIFMSVIRQVNNFSIR
jgi:hypothetical protein